jgi:hypothetical protein
VADHEICVKKVYLVKYDLDKKQEQDTRILFEHQWSESENINLVDAVLVRDFILLDKNVRSGRESEDLFKENQYLVKIFQTNEDKIHFDITNLQNPEHKHFSFGKNEPIKMKLDMWTKTGPLFFRFKKGTLRSIKKQRGEIKAKG